MMMKSYLLALTLLFAPFTQSFAQSTNEEASGTGNLRGIIDNNEMEVQHRQLSWGSGFDFSNMLFHLGVCTEHSCEYCAQHKQAGPLPHCGCPRCDLPHAHKLPQCSCSSSGSSGSSTSSSTESATEFDEAAQEEEEEEVEEVDESAASGAEESNSNLADSQTATRSFSMVVYFAGAAACAALLAAVVMRKRQTSREIDLDSDGLSPDSASAVHASLSNRFSALMAGLGVGVPAVVMTRDYAGMDDVAPYQPTPVRGAEGYAI
ncbi:hypothetical protein MPSEU_001095600 [Mayamaea pseudoterrestris]|nr:hypothetical protein MPSEU_001095600 [Mayamaea pseudoterrestris]